MPRPSSLPKLALLVAGLVAGIALAESIATLLDLPRSYQPPVKDPYLRIAADPADPAQVHWTQVPSASPRFVYDGDPRGYFGPDHAVRHRTNSLGLRGDEFRLAPEPGALRIAFLGDSFTFGEGVKDEDTFAERVGERLRTADPGREAEIQNWGIGGTNTVQQARLFADSILAYQPDVLVLGVTINDAEPTLFYRDSSGRVLRRDPILAELHEDRSDSESGWKRLRLARLLAGAVTNRRRSQDFVASLQGLYADDVPDWAACQSAMATIGALCRERGVRCYGVLIPLLYRLSDYPLLEVHQKLGDAIARAGLTLVDVLPELHGFDGPELWVHPTDHHPNETVHRVIANLVAGRVIGALGDPDADR